MKVHKNYNLGVEPPKLEGIYTYKMLGIVKNADGSYSGAYEHIIQSEDRIIQGGAYRDIASIQSVDSKGNPNFTYLSFKREDAWTIRLDSANIAERELIEYLELTNYNESNPNRDKGIAPVFYRQDLAKEAKEKMDVERTLAKAKIKVFDWSESELKTFALARGINANQDPEILRDIALSVAEADPAGFLGVKVEAESTKALVEQARVSGLINFDEATKEWRWNDTGDSIYKINGQSRFAAKNFADWLESDGGAVLETLKSKV